MRIAECFSSADCQYFVIENSVARGFLSVLFQRLTFRYKPEEILNEIIQKNLF